MTADNVLDILEKKAKGAFVRELGIHEPNGIRRVDALDFSSAMRTAFEVKVSRSDWRRECEEKRSAWKSVTHRYIYVCPEGVIPVSEAPEDCGLWWVCMDPVPGTDRMNPRLEVMRKAPKNPDPLDIPWRVTMNLCYREQHLLKRIKNANKDYQSAYNRAERLLADIKAINPSYSEWSGR